MAKEKKSKERNGKKSQPGKTASKDDDPNPYYNVFARCDRHEVGHADNGNDGDKQTPGKSVNISKIAAKPDEKYSDDDGGGGGGHFIKLLSIYCSCLQESL